MTKGETLGTRLRRLRTERGMTQKQLSGDRYTHAYVSTIEAGRRTPSREALEHFAAQLGVGVDELWTGRPPDVAARLELRFQEARLALSAGRPGRAEAELVAVARRARQTGLTEIESRAEQALGLLLERRNRHEDALEHHRRAEALVAGAAAAARADALAGTARCFAALGDGNYAIHLLESLLGELRRREITDPDALARLHASLVGAYLDSGLPGRAAESAAELDRLAPRLQDPERIAAMHMNVARLHLAQGRPGDAERSLERAEEAYRVLRLQAEAGRAHLARGHLLSREDRLEEARAELERARETFEETGDTEHLARTLNELGRVERMSGDDGRARSVLERSIDVLGGRDTPTVAAAHRELALSIGPEDAPAAEKHLRTAIELYERANQAADVAVCYRALGDLLADGGSERDAADAYRTGILALEPRP